MYNMKVFLEPSADVRMILDRRYQLKNSEKYSSLSSIKSNVYELSLLSIELTTNQMLSGFGNTSISSLFLLLPAIAF